MDKKNQVNISVHKELKERLEKEAKKHYKKLTQFIIDILIEYINKV